MAGSINVSIPMDNDYDLVEYKEFCADSQHACATSIKILVTGKSGCGKTTLISGLIGVQPTQDQGIPTRELKEHCVRLDGIEVTVWDSPGLQDGTDARTQERYLQEMKDKCGRRDLTMYCIKIIDTRFVHTANNPDVVAMKKFTQTFGEAFWEDCIIVLTYANTILTMCSVEVDDWDSLQQEEQDRIFLGKIEEWRQQVREILIQDIGIRRDIADKVKIVPAGHFRKPHLPGCRYWFSNLWFKCANRIRSPEVRCALIKINQNRLKNAEDIDEERDLARPLHQQPIAATAKKINKIVPFNIVGGGLAGGFVGGTVCGLVSLVAGPAALPIIPVGTLVGAIGGCVGTATGVINLEKFKDWIVWKSNNK